MSVILDLTLVSRTGVFHFVGFKQSVYKFWSGYRPKDHMEEPEVPLVSLDITLYYKILQKKEIQVGGRYFL